MRPSDLLALSEGSIIMEGEPVEGTVSVVFPPCDGPHGTIQALKIKDSPDAPRETEVTVQFRGRPPVPVDASGATIRIAPRVRRGGPSGVAWIARPGRRGRHFPMLVVMPPARIEIGDPNPERRDS